MLRGYDGGMGIHSRIFVVFKLYFMMFFPSAYLFHFIFFSSETRFSRLLVNTSLLIANYSALEPLDTRLVIGRRSLINIV
jgi:hypothetical protein